MTRLKKITQALITIGAISASPLLFAIEPQSFQAGAIDFTPTVDVDYSHTDNQFKTTDNEVSSNIFKVNPKLEGKVQDGANTYSVAGEILYGDYSYSSKDDYTDWKVDGAAHFALNARNALDLNAGFYDTHEVRGSGFSQGGLIPADADTYEETTFGASYQYGTRSSFGRLVVGVNNLDKDYTNNRLTTQFRDRENFDWDATFYLNVSDRTDMFVEYSASDINYKTDPNAIIGTGDTLDSDETYIYAGITWGATAKTNGSFKIGYGEKSFDDSDRKDVDGLVWEANINWEPRSYSTFNINTKQGFEEASGVGNALDTTQYGINWTHSWNDMISSTLGARHSKDDYAGSTRNDSLDSFSLKIDYAFDRWLDLYISLSKDKRDSNFNGYSYKENVAAIGFSASL